jgi:glycosyltransferase involved in cell wall biosynthesis
MSAMITSEISKKILIIVPSFKILGGVANHYQGLATHWKYNVEYLFYGKRKKIPAIVTFLPDLFVYIFKMMFFKYDAVIINPSLRPYQLKRDGLYLRIAHFFRKKVVTFIHGWDYNLANEISKSPKCFCKTYGRSCFMYVLYSGFKETLDALPWNVPVLLTTTKVKDELLDGFDILQRNGEVKTLLFLARADKLKGLDVAIRAFEMLKRNNPKLRLIVCGTGNALDETKEYVAENNIQDVCFKGHVAGPEVAEEFKKSDIYILPTHGEGMATSVLEAMAFGLPIISRPVGGVNDFFKNGEMGYLLESFSPEDYAGKIQYLIDNPDVVRKMAYNNHEYAKGHFLASKVAERIENDLEKMI